MTTMLEKAARALAVEYYGPAADENDLTMASEQWPGFLALARAALQAIREPSPALREKLSFEAADEWADAFDAILEGKA